MRSADFNSLAQQNSLNKQKQTEGALFNLSGLLKS